MCETERERERGRKRKGERRGDGAGEQHSAGECLARLGLSPFLFPPAKRRSCNQQTGEKITKYTDRMERDEEIDRELNAGTSGKVGKGRIKMIQGKQTCVQSSH